MKPGAYTISDPSGKKLDILLLLFLVLLMDVKLAIKIPAFFIWIPFEWVQASLVLSFCPGLDSG
jgi:hypothetical protein